MNNPKPNHCVNGTVSKRRKPPPGLVEVGTAEPAVTVLAEDMFTEELIGLNVDELVRTDVGELVGSVKPVVSKVIADVFGDKREDDLYADGIVKLGIVSAVNVDTGIIAVGAGPPKKGVQFCSASLQAYPLSQQAVIAQVHIGPPSHSLMQIQTPFELPHATPI